MRVIFFGAALFHFFPLQNDRVLVLLHVIIRLLKFDTNIKRVVLLEFARARTLIRVNIKIGETKAVLAILAWPLGL